MSSSTTGGEMSIRNESWLGRSSRLLKVAQGASGHAEMRTAWPTAITAWCCSRRSGPTSEYAKLIKAAVGEVIQLAVTLTFSDGTSNPLQPSQISWVTFD